MLCAQTFNKNFLNYTVGSEGFNTLSQVVSKQYHSTGKCYKETLKVGVVLSESKKKKPDTMSNLLTYYLISQGKPQTKMLHQQIDFYHPGYDKEGADRCLGCVLCWQDMVKHPLEKKCSSKQGKQRQLEGHVLDYSRYENLGIINFSYLVACRKIFNF